MNLEPAHFIGILGGGCCCFLFMAGLAFLVYKLMSGKKGEPPPPAAYLTDRRPAPQPVAGIPDLAPRAAQVVNRVSQYGNIISRTTDEGFYFFNEYLLPGSMIHYRYRGAAGWVTRSIPYQPGPQGHFVYLGGPPQDLEVVDVVPFNAGVPGDVEQESSMPTILTGPPPGLFQPHSNQPPPPVQPMIISDPDDHSPPNPAGVPPSLIKTTGDYPAAY